MSDGQMGGSGGILNRVVKVGLTEKGTKRVKEDGRWRTGISGKKVPGERNRACSRP